MLDVVILHEKNKPNCVNEAPVLVFQPATAGQQRRGTAQKCE